MIIYYIGCREDPTGSYNIYVWAQGLCTFFKCFRWGCSRLLLALNCEPYLPCFYSFWVSSLIFNILIDLLPYLVPCGLYNSFQFSLCVQWAFGVTAWEIFTCGRIPYAGISAMGLLKALQSGEKLEKPDNEVCQDEMLVICSNPHIIIIVIVVHLHLSEWV